LFFQQQKQYEIWLDVVKHTEMLLFVIPSTFAIAGLLWRLFKQYPSTIITQLTKENQYLIDQCPSLVEYRPTPWIINGHFMTVLGVIFRPLLALTFERITLPVDDTGGTIAIDWHMRPHARQPILLILHGLTGGSDNEFIRWMIKAANSQLHLCCVVAHARGCGKSKLTSARSFCATNTDDIRAALKYIRSIVGNDTPIFAVGYSLGAGILSKFLGEESDRCSLQGAIACCASFDMHISCSNLERWFAAHFYNRRLTNNLIHYMKQHEEHFIRQDSDVVLDLKHAYQSRTIRDFDRHIIIPQYGFRDVEQYYTEASSKVWLKSIRIPTLILNAIDDPICSIDGLPTDDILKNPSIIAVRTLEGGHVGYLQGWWPNRFSYDNVVVVDYIKARLKQMNYQWNEKTDETSTALRIDIV
jgi:predicted alpha/beta-fold hydrolase